MDEQGVPKGACESWSGFWTQRYSLQYRGCTLPHTAQGVHVSSRLILPSSSTPTQIDFSALSNV